MFDKLDDLLIKYDELTMNLNDPQVINDNQRFRKMMKEQSDLTPIVETYKAYKESKQAIEDSLAILEEESDEEMKELYLRQKYTECTFITLNHRIGKWRRLKWKK